MIVRSHLNFISPLSYEFTKTEKNIHQATKPDTARMKDFKLEIISDTQSFISPLSHITGREAHIPYCKYTFFPP